MAVLFALGFATMLQASPRSEKQMLGIAKGTLAQHGMRKAPGMPQDDTPEVLHRGGNFSVIGYADGGFAVVTSDDRFDAVIGYSDSKFTYDNMPPALSWWLEAADASLEKAMLAGKASERVAPGEFGMPADMRPLLTTLWNQQTPYNNLCPMNGREHYLTGCVATSMSQMMNYHKYPDQGVGRHSYRFNPGTGALTLSANFGSTTYDWSNMVDNYETMPYNDAQANAVATLMFHCGVSVDMNYMDGASGATHTKATTALKSYFKYSAKYMSRSIFSTREWMYVIFRELASGMPIIYGGSSNSGGHSFMFDGYNSDGLVHVNWGWGGAGDGYFDVATLNGYTEYQDMVLSHPLNNPDNAIPYQSVWSFGADFIARSTGNKKVVFSSQMIFNADLEDFSGQVAILVLPAEGSGGQALPINNPKDVKFGYGFEFSNAEINFEELADGDYILLMGSMSENESSWQFMRSPDNIVNSYIMSIRGNSLTLKPQESGWFIPTGITDVTVGGDGNADVSGMVRVYDVRGMLVYTSKAEDFNINDVPARGLLIIKNGSKTTKVVKD